MGWAIMVSGLPQACKAADEASVCEIGQVSLGLGRPGLKGAGNSVICTLSSGLNSCSGGTGTHAVAQCSFSLPRYLSVKFTDW